MDVLDLLGESPDVIYGIGSAQPAIACVQTNADGFGMPQAIDQFGHCIDVIGDDAVRLEQQLDAKFLGP